MKEWVPDIGAIQWKQFLIPLHVPESLLDTSVVPTRLIVEIDKGMSLDQVLSEACLKAVIGLGIEVSETPTYRLPFNICSKYLNEDRDMVGSWAITISTEKDSTLRSYLGDICEGVGRLYIDRPHIKDSRCRVLSMTQLITLYEEDK